MIEAAVNTYVTPAGMKSLMAGTEPAMPDGLHSAGEQPTYQTRPTNAAAAVQLSYKTPNLFVISARDPSPPQQTIEFNFVRSSLVDWKLTSISLP